MSFRSSSLSAPNKAEQLRMDLIVEGGCIVCRHFLCRDAMCEVHHLTGGGQHGQPRRGHAFTVGLCTWHHRGVAPAPARVMMANYGPSYALDTRLFREAYGNDDALMRLQAVRLAEVNGSYLISRGVYA